MSRRAAGDPLPLWVKLLMLVAPVSLIGGYLAYESELQESDKAKSPQVIDDMGMQFHTGANRDEASMESGLAVGSTNIGSQGSVYQERMVDLSASKSLAFSADDSVQAFLGESDSETALLSGVGEESNSVGEGAIRFLPAAAAEFGSGQP
ncbi:hypothetical protein [Cerasicoccus maritimus]|uniref:hypothetical protein n=1 Tax=Cerasicoccus maritimus TaxID=490089 RepID=UPI00285263A7|nr:hypothetical protein [Cerasicoccus maritimus]